MNSIQIKDAILAYKGPGPYDSDDYAEDRWYSDKEIAYHKAIAALLNRFMVDEVEDVHP